MIRHQWLMTETRNGATIMERNDCHSPKNLIPADYQYVAPECVKTSGGLDLGACEYIAECRRIIREHMERTGGAYSNHEHGGTCMVCGSVNAIYTVLFYHAKTNTYIRTGQECAALIDANIVPKFATLKKAVKTFREYAAGKKKAQGILAEKNLSRAWEISESYKNTAGYKYEECTINDIVNKIVKYGNASDRALEFVAALIKRIDERTIVEAKREAEKAAAADCPEGKRIEVTGEVISVRTDDTPYGMVTKMLIKAAEGFKVWGTMPAGANADKGDIITIRATIKRSDQDSKFGFSNRPHLIKIEHKAEAAEPVNA
jgi:hypothetical protein